MAKGSANDGGQLWPNEGRDHPGDMDMLLDKANGYEMGTVTAHDFGPDKNTPEYSYIAGDISKAYYSLKASLVTRSMITLNTSSTAYPCIFVVFDRITSLKQSYKKTWLLHSIEEPNVLGQTITIRNTGAHYSGNGRYSGKLVAQSLLPKDALIQKVGGSGKEFWVESVSKNYYTEKQNGAEPGAWRIEISPAQAAEPDVFFNVLSVMDTATGAGPQVSLIKNDSIAAVRVLDRIVAFSKENRLLTELSITVEGAQNAKLLVCDAAHGAWTIKHQNAVYETAVVSQGAHTLYVNCIPGTYQFQQTGSATGMYILDGPNKSNYGPVQVYDARGRRAAILNNLFSQPTHGFKSCCSDGIYIIREKNGIIKREYINRSP
jgi:hypothetical protein